MKIIIAVVNGKGGVGKTTTTEMLGVILGSRGRPVTLIDLDPQANLTDRLLSTTAENRPHPTIADVLDGSFSLYDALTAVPDRDCLRLVPTDAELDDTDSRMVIDNFGVLKLRNILEDAQGLGDFILIDCPPNLGSLTTAALIAADYVIIPVQPEPSAIAGVERIERKLAEIHNALRRAPRVLGTVATFVEDVKLHGEGLGKLHRGYMPPLLGQVPKRKGLNAWAELRTAYESVADAILTTLGVAKAVQS